jgi:hypothetical protein
MGMEVGGTLGFRGVLCNGRRRREGSRRTVLQFNMPRATASAFFLSASFPSILSLKVKQFIARAGARATVNLSSLLFLLPLTLTPAYLCILALELER